MSEMDPNQPPQPDVQSAAELTDDEKQMAMLTHLLGAFTGFVGPLIIWLIKKDESAFVDDQGKQALNFQITVAIAFIALGILTMIPFVGCITIFPLMILPIPVIILSILAALQAKDGVQYRYPVAIPFLS